MSKKIINEQMKTYSLVVKRFLWVSGKMIEKFDTVGGIVPFLWGIGLDFLLCVHNLDALENDL